MATTDKNTIYSWFQTDDFPTEEQFRATWDSYWHKSESIPMSQITGLNQLFQQTATVAQLNDKANVDGSNINVSAYQEKLNITNLIATAKEEVKTELLNGAPEAFDTLKEISDWISDDETAEAAILQAIQNEATARTNADNQKLDKGNYTGTAQDLKNSIDGKLSKPTITSNTASYPFVVGEDGNGNSARLPAGDLGKNFFNSDLSNTTARNHTMNAGVTVNTLGNAYSLKNLPNKNNDTEFNKILVANATGQQAIVDNSYNILKSTITPMTDAQKLEIANLLGASTGSAGTPSVNLISPPIIQSQYDSVEYILLRGANLYLNSASMSVEILAADKTTIVATIPNNQIQLYADGTQLIFYYNFYNWTIGQYFIRLTSGIKTYTTTLDLNIVNSISNKDLSLLTWSLLKANGVENTPYDVFNATNVILTSSSVGAEGFINKSLKSSEIFAQGENFYLEIKFNINSQHPTGIGINPSFVSLAYSNTNNSLSSVGLLNLIWSWHDNLSAQGYRIYLEGQPVVYFNAPVSKTITIVKTGNLFRLSMDSIIITKTLSNNSGYSLFLQNVPRASMSPIEVQIIKAFTF